MTRSRAAGKVAVILPVLDERDALPGVLADIPREVADRVIVVDNGSTDGSGEIARAAGAEVVLEPRRGYGSACLAGIAATRDEDVLVFLDADRSDDATAMRALVAPILDGRADLVVGSRALGRREPGALSPHVRLGNALAVGLIRLVWGERFTDLGPFRAIRRTALERIGMRDRGYGWTVEMQVRAARGGLRCLEIPADYRRRVGRSKISGTVRGTIAAGSKILWTIARHAATGRTAGPPPAASRELAPAAIDVVIPALDEERNILPCLDALARQEGPLTVTVVDGGSRDATAVRAASRESVRVLAASLGRGRQLAAGVAAGHAPIVWMLHADCRPHPGSARAIRRALADPRVAVGAFRFALDGPRRAYRAIERGVAFRSRRLRAPYGDQGLFARRADVERAGGVPELPVLEDIELVRALRRHGRVEIVDLPLVTSARRWESGGIVRTTARHLAIATLHRLGVPPARLARLRATRTAECGRDPGPESAPPARPASRP